MPKKQNPQTRDELFASDRGEREYYISRSKNKSMFKQNMKLPLTLDGCMALLEIVTEALDIPMDETIIQVFCGYIHHLPQTENSTSFDVLGKVLYKNMANGVTWELDQKTKEIAQEKKTKELALKKANEEREQLTVVEDSTPCPQETSLS